MTPLYAALVVPHLAAQACLRLRPALASTPLAILEGARPHEHLFSANPSALALGLTSGMSRLEAESFPNVHILPRSLTEEHAAAAILLEATTLFTPRTEPHPTPTPSWECLLDLTGTERLLGSPEDLGRQILTHLASLGFTASIALCENPDAALSLARAARHAITFVASQSLSAALAPLPLAALNLDPDDQDRFAAWGIHTLGELAALPEPALIARLGQPGLCLRQRARGELSHLLQPHQPAFQLLEALDFDEPLETLEPLLFCLNPMLEQLILRAHARALSLAAVTLTLTLHQPADRSLHETPTSTAGRQFLRIIRPAVPTSNRPLLLKMLQLDLEAHPCPGAITRLHLSAEPGTPSRVQLGLFAPPQPEPTRFEDTHARLVSLVGEANVGRLQPLDTHAPDAFRLDRFHLPGPPNAPQKAQNPQPATVLRRLRPPAPVHVRLATSRTIQAFHFEARRFEVLRCFGPWRSSGDWWHPTQWSTDTWDLAARAADDGELLLCVLAHNLLDGQWHLHGIYD